MKQSRQIGIVLGSIHALAFTIFLATMFFGKVEGPQAALYWLVWMPIDFPWSWIGITAAGPWSDPIAAAFGFHPWHVWTAIMIISHGVFGTVWWFFVPQAVASIFRSRRFLH